MSRTTQNNNTVTDGDIVAGNKIINNHPKASKLNLLFENLKANFNDGNEATNISDNLKRYSEPRDIIGLEQKLIDGRKEYLLDDAIWLKQEYNKKLTKYQFYEPAQEIHAFLLSIVLEKFRNRIYPMIRQDSISDLEISTEISNAIVNPILQMIQEHGCDDIMGLNATDIEGMIYFLTGLCHIKWIKE